MPFFENVTNRNDNDLNDNVLKYASCVECPKKCKSVPYWGVRWGVA